MIVEYTRYKIDAGRQKEFEKDYRKAGEALLASKHCLAYELTQCAEEVEWFVLRIEWDSEEGHMEGFRKSAEFREFFAHIRPYVRDIAEMRHYKRLGIEGRK